MKSLMLLLQHVLDDIENRCCISTTLDRKTIERRVETEGESFLTITLSNFGKDFERSLDQGYVSSQLFVGFKRKEALPRLFLGLLELIFDRASGTLLERPDVDAIQALRQITLMWSKIKVPCSDARNNAAINGYLNCEVEIANLDAGTISFQARHNLWRIFQILFQDALQSVEEDVVYGRLRPKHGPGATADKLKGNQKFNQTVWTERLEKVFCSSDYLIPNYRYWEHLQTMRFLEPGEEEPVKVTLVPKTSKTPRLIAVEPTCMQYAQQSVAIPLVSALESKTNLSSHFVGFTDQGPNQDLARKGSKDGSLATIDLSEASDRVRYSLVKGMLENFPNLWEAIDACRSQRARLPKGDIVTLTKFASMGSALCFPIEAMVFTAVAFYGIERERGVPLTKKDILSFRGQVRVYGDDIVVPTDYVQSVIRALETFGFRVNASKSFWTGKFRESCGKEYYEGHDVTVVKIRQYVPASRTDVEQVVSTVATRNLLYWSGYWNTVNYLDDVLWRLLRYFPHIEGTSPVLGRESVFSPMAESIHPDYHTPLVKGYRVVARSPINKLDDTGALLKFFLKGSDEPSIEGHLERSGRPDAVNIKLGLASPY